MAKLTHDYDDEEGQSGGEQRPQAMTEEDLLNAVRLIFGYSEIMKFNLANSQLAHVSQDLEKINRTAWQTLAAFGSSDVDMSFGSSLVSFDAEHFMQVFAHSAKLQLSKSCRDLQFFVPVGFGEIAGDLDSLLDLCMAGLDFLHSTSHPSRICVHLFPSQVDGKDFVNVDIRAQGGNVSGSFDRSFDYYFHTKNSARVQKACEELQANFSLDVCQGVGLTFSVTFAHRVSTQKPMLPLRREGVQPSILLLGTDSKVERMIKDLTRESELEILSVSQLRSGLRVFYEKQPAFVMVDASEDGWGAGELIESIRQQNKSCFIVSLVHKGMADYSEFPGADLMLEKPFRKDDLLRSMGVIGPGSRRLA